MILLAYERGCHMRALSIIVLALAPTFVLATPRHPAVVLDEAAAAANALAGVAVAQDAAAERAVQGVDNVRALRAEVRQNRGVRASELVVIPASRPARPAGTSLAPQEAVTFTAIVLGN